MKAICHVLIAIAIVAGTVTASPMPGATASESDVRDALRLLDTELQRRHTYITARQNYIDSLSAICRAESSTDEAPYPALAHAYAGFNNDSALSILRRAESSHSKDKQHEARMHMASLLPLAGLFDSAEAKLAEVDTTLIGRESMPAYYEHARQMYSYFAAFFERYPELRQRYASQSMRMQAKLLEVLDPESDEYLFNLGEHAYLNGQNPRARVLLSELLARDTISDMLRARRPSPVGHSQSRRRRSLMRLLPCAINHLRPAFRHTRNGFASGTRSPAIHPWRHRPCIRLPIHGSGKRRGMRSGSENA